MSNTARLGMTYIAAGTAAEQPHNLALNILDTLVASHIISRIVTAPPAAVDGDAYIIPTGATGDWSGRDGQIASRYGNQWLYITPKTNMSAWVEDEQAIVRYVTSSWRSALGETIFAAARITSDFAVANSPTWSPLEWNSQIKYVADGVFTHDTSTNPDEITLDEAGEYEVTADLTFVASGSSGASRVDAKLTVNTSDVATSFGSCYVDAGGALRQQINLTCIVNVTAGQVLRIEAQRAAGSGTINLVHSYSRVRVRKIS